MALRLGVGIVTFNRKNVLAETLARVQAHTTSPFTLVVADDGSEDGTDKLVREKNVTLVTGQNMGIAWNKNRALFLLADIMQCDVVILLEDDTFPIRDGWEGEWVDAAHRWGHSNCAGEWFRSEFLKGSGTLDDPILCKVVTAQCSVYSREALRYGGYLDSRFFGFGQEHVEHTRRLIRVGRYGGTYEDIDGEVRPIYKLIWGGIQVTTPPSFSNRADTERNWRVCQQLLFEETYRAPWRDDIELAQFHAEMARAVASAMPGVTA
jgi:glycosyltransferase involved in cell wall biosynthesis